MWEKSASWKSCFSLLPNQSNVDEFSVPPFPLGPESRTESTPSLHICKFLLMPRVISFEQDVLARKGFVTNSTDYSFFSLIFSLLQYQKYINCLKKQWVVMEATGRREGKTHKKRLIHFNFGNYCAKKWNIYFHVLWCPIANLLTPPWANLHATYL